MRKFNCYTIFFSKLYFVISYNVFYAIAMVKRKFNILFTAFLTVATSEISRFRFYTLNERKDETETISSTLNVRSVVYLLLIL